MLPTDCIFCKIIAKEIPSSLEYEDEFCIAFHDINPRASKHLLIVPKKHIATLNEMEDADEATMGRIIRVARDLAKKIGMPSYKLFMSVGKEAGQEVFHLHLHVMSPK
jgi:histidine triad (HIT) family protein